MKHLLLLALVVVLMAAACNKTPATQDTALQQTPVPETPTLVEKTPTAPASTAPAATAQLSAPLDRAQERITKKPFGIKVSPGNSPVDPEKFSGYHTGTDFEAFADEQDKDIVVKTICDGPLLQKRSATGYGGLATQSCTIDGQSVTVVYGHLKLSSITATANQQLKAGDTIGILGKGYSPETNGERKHLHLGIHKGQEVNIKGYVQAQQELNQWLDAQKYF